MCSISGISVSPSSVRLYSVLGGTTGYTFLEISPSASISRSCLVIILPVASGTSDWISLNLFVPPLRFQRITDLYLPPMSFTVSLTGHSAITSSSIIPMLYFLIVYFI